MATSTQMRKLFVDLYGADDEDEVSKILFEHGNLTAPNAHWKPLGDNLSNVSIIQNQQGHPAAALVEKITNAIDAVLTRRCLEESIDPKGKNAPRNMEAAIERFFGKNLWDDKATYDRQAEDIQVLAHGLKGNSSLVIYDAGEGQHPDEFPSTFLSLVKGNKKDIPFVQGMYNMGGTGAIVFCGQLKYQLIGSRRYDGSGAFGYTLVRRHPMNEKDEGEKASVWYEYLTLKDGVPRFEMDAPLELGLKKGRVFTTGSIIKMYSYRLPSGLRANIAQELYQSITEFLVHPALPVWVADSAKRYPKTKVLERSLVGLRRVVEQKSGRVIDETLSFDEVTEYGRLIVDCYVFNPTLGEKSYQEARKSLQRQFFFNGGHVLFSVNGQVHGSWGMQFISQSLGMPLLKHHLLVIVDCTRLRTEFRNDLFMASRDRLANSEQSQAIREILKSWLKDSKLKDIHEFRRQSLGVQSGSAAKAIRSYVSSLRFDSALKKMIQGQLDADDLDDTRGAQDGGTAQEGTKKKKGGAGSKGERKRPDFRGRRFPSYFHLVRRSGADERTPAARIPPGEKRSVRFKTDAEDEYFSRSEEPGSLDLTLLGINRGRGGTGKQKRSKGNAGGERIIDVSDVFHVERVGPEAGIIRLRLTAKDALDVGDSVQVSATLSSELTDITEIFWVRVVEPKPKDPDADRDVGRMAGLPDPVLVGRDKRAGMEIAHTWEELEGLGVGIDFSEETVVYPMMSEERVDRIFINMDSRVLSTLLLERGELDEQQHGLLVRQYVTVMYLHSLLLCGGAGAQGYTIRRPDPSEMGRDDDVDPAEFVADVFANGYAEFLMRFRMTDVLDALDD